MLPASPPIGDAANRPTPERQVADALLSGLLLAFAGGALDAFLYLTHGHVFAGAMTGNAVLCGIALLSDNRHEALAHFLPILAFALGVWAAELLQDRLRHHAVATGLACEALGLFACSFLPDSFPRMIFVPLISLLAAYQVASFRQVDTFAYNSTFITGDLRTAIVGLYRTLRAAPPGSEDTLDRAGALRQDRAQGLRQARDLGLVILCFLLGAVAGAVLSPHLGNRALWLPILALLTVLALTLTTTHPDHPGSPS